MTSRKIVIERHNNSIDNFVIHLDAELQIRETPSSFNRSLCREGDRWFGLGSQERLLVEGLLSVPGVKRITLHAYMIYLSKARLFSITDIVNGITEVFITVYGKNVEVISTLSSS